MAEVRFYDPLYQPAGKLIYAIVAARYLGKWIFVRHKERDTFEIPAGHIEYKEAPEEAAARELREETGAIRFIITCVSTYSVEKNGEMGFGRLYLADIMETGPLPENSEIGEVIMMDTLPENLTHPDIQPWLFRRVIDFIDKKEEV